MTNDEYKKGWYDGYHAAKNEAPTFPIAPAPIRKLVNKNCEVCGIAFYNPDGTLKIMGYVCSKDKCPSRITY
jgi:hypothetical protein